MGYQVGSLCYETDTDAAVAVAASLFRFDSATNCLVYANTTTNPQLQIRKTCYTNGAWVDTSYPYYWIQAARLPRCGITVDPTVPWNLDLPAGQSIASAILVVWAIAWGFRSVIRTIKSSPYEADES